MVELSRRGFLAGLGTALITAPAIVRASSIMPVKQVLWTPTRQFILPASVYDAMLNAVGENIMKRDYIREDRLLVKVDWHNLYRLS